MSINCRNCNELAKAKGVGYYLGGYVYFLREESITCEFIREINVEYGITHWVQVFSKVEASRRANGSDEYEGLSDAGDWRWRE